MKLLLITPLLVATILVSGCIGQINNGVQSGPSVTSPDVQAKKACVDLCFQEKKSRDLGSGPCLSNEIMPDWVCDVAHNPRQDVDNNPANQCPAFGKTAQHFIEVDPDCNFIRSY
jgi:hypothetical protein